MKARSARFVFLPFIVVMIGIAPAVQGIIIRHDRADSRYVIRESDFPQVFSLYSRFDNSVCTGTLISKQWGITAAHCTEETPLKETLAEGEAFQLTIARNEYAVSELVIHPDYLHPQQSQSVDLALIKLDREVRRVTPVTLYQAVDEKNKILTLLGWGYTGIGTLGRSSNDGKFRRAENAVFSAGQWLGFRFDDPRPVNNQALSLEGTPGLGDSGGPALLEIENELFLLGVALGEVAEADEQERQGRYGAVALYERISSHYSWIQQVIQAD